MKTIPNALYSKKILSYIDNLVDLEAAKDFFSLDELYQDQLVSLGIEALGGDIELILSTEGNLLLSKYLSTYAKDVEFDLLEEIKKSSRQQFESFFNQMILEEIDSRRKEKLYSHGLRPIQDSVTGETLWI